MTEGTVPAPNTAPAHRSDDDGGPFGGYRISGEPQRWGETTVSVQCGIDHFLLKTDILAILKRKVHPSQLR